MQRISRSVVCLNLQSAAYVDMQCIRMLCRIMQLSVDDQI